MKTIPKVMWLLRASARVAASCKARARRTFNPSHSTHNATSSVRACQTGWM